MFFDFRGFLVSFPTIYSYKNTLTMKNRLQFNRIPTVFTGATETRGGEEVWVSGREQAAEALDNYIKRGSFIPLIGEPIVLRYTDDNGDRQVMLAIGKSTGTTIDMVDQRKYHIIDTAALQEGVDQANENASEALELASAATKDTADYLTILKNMILSGIGLTDGTYFDNNGRWDRDPSGVGLYDPDKVDDTFYLKEATSFLDADKKLDAAIVATNAWLNGRADNLQQQIDDEHGYRKAIAIKEIDQQYYERLGLGDDIKAAYFLTTHKPGEGNFDQYDYPQNGEVIIKVYKDEVSREEFENVLEAEGLNPDGTYDHERAHESTNFIDAFSAFEADELLDKAITELSANTMAADQALKDELNDKIDELSANTMAADEALDNKIDELSANTMAADQELADRIEDLEGRKVLGISAITVNTLENGDSRVSLLINEEDDKVLTQNTLGLKANVSLVYSHDDKKIYLKGKNDTIISEVDAKDFIKDGMLSAASVFTATEADHQQYPELVVGKTYIKLLFNVDGEEPGRANPVFISAEDLVDIYSVAPESHTFMEIDDYVIKLNVDVEDGLASYNYARNISAVTANIISATGLNMGEQGSYPGHDETHYIKNAGSLDQADVLLDEAIWGASQDLAELSAATEDFSGATHTIIENILAGTGLNTQGPGEYHGHDETHYIKDATSLDNADVLLDAAIWETSGLVADISNRLDDLSAVTESFSAHTVEALSALSASVDERIESGLTLISGVVENYVEEMLSGLNFDEIYEYVDNSVEALSGALLDYIIDNEEVTAAALNDLNRRTLYFETHYTGEYIPITNYTLATGTTEEELILDEDDSINEAFGKIQKQILDNEEAVAAGLNDLNRRVNENAEAIAQNTGVTALSAAVMSFSSATHNRFENLQTSISSAFTNINVLSGVVEGISAKTSGVLTINVNGEEQGKYSPSADTTVDLEIIQEVTGADVLLKGYELASGTTEEELAIVATDTVNEAFGKIQKQMYDNEAVIAGALNDLDERIHDIEAGGGTDNFFDGAEYDSNTKRINFKHGNEIKTYIDATDFIKDGMVDNVEVTGGNLVITFNTDAGKEAISIPLTSIFNPNNYYTKTEIDALSSATVNMSGAVVNNQTNINTVSGDVISLSASVVTNKTNITNLSGSVVTLSGDVTALSASVVTNKENIESLSASLIDDELVIAAALNDLNSRVHDLELNAMDPSNYYTKTEVDQKFDALGKTYKTSNTVQNLVLDKYLTIASVNADTTLSVDNNSLPELPTNGVYEAHVIIQNTSNSAIVVTLASNAKMKMTTGDKIAIDPQGIGEFNALITYDGSDYTIYVITT